MKIKRIGFFIALLLFYTGITFADAGCCVRYHVEILLKNNTQHRVYYQHFDYTPITDKNDKKLLKAIKQYKNKLTFYSRLQKIKYPQLYDANPHGFKYTAAAIEDTIKIDPKEILKLHILSIDTCETFEKRTKTSSPGNDFYIEIYPWVIEGLSQQEIDLLQSKPVHKLFIRCNYSDSDPPDGVTVLYYGSGIPAEELRRVCRALWAEKAPVTDDDREKEEQRFRRIKKQLREKKIIVLRFNQMT